MSWIKNILIVFVVSVISVKAIDFTFGLIKGGASGQIETGKRYVQLREFNPVQEIVFRPSDEYMLGTDSLVQQGYSVIIDDNGFIWNGNPTVEESDAIKILFLGGSTTESIYVNTLNRFPSVVERELRDTLSKPVITLNGGVSGNNSIHSLINLIAKGIDEKPDVAVLMHNINDLSLLSKTGSYWKGPISKAIVVSESQERTNNLSAYSVFRSVKNLFVPNLYAYLKPRLFPTLTVKDEFAQFREQEVAEHDVVINQFRNTLESFVAICKSWEIKPVLMTQFNRVNNNDILFNRWADTHLNYKSSLRKDEFINLYERINDVTRMVASEHDTQLIDLAKLVPQNSDYLYDIVHLNDEGSLFVADIISAHLRDILVVE